MEMNKKKVILFGAGDFGKNALKKINKTKYKVLGFVDNDKSKSGELVKGFTVYHVSELQSLDFDLIFITSQFFPEIRNQLNELKIYNYKIIKKSKNVFSKIQSFIARQRNILKRGSVFVYQPGKTASNSFYSSLKKYNIPTVSTHTIGNHDYLNYQTLWDFDENHSKPYEGILETVFRFLSKQTMRLKKDKLIIVTGVRDPLAIYISMVFQALHLLIKDRYEYSILSKEKFLDCFLNILHVYVNKDYVEQWMAGELEYFTGIDVVDANLSKQDKYFVLENQDFRVLIYKYEYLKELQEDISTFFGLTDFLLLSENKAQNKWYYTLYEEIIDELKFDSEFLDSIYLQKYVKTIYSDAEIALFRSRWTHQ